jgi:hypothetical protein
VNILTALGDSARNYVINEFKSLGTHLVIIMITRCVPNDLNSLLYFLPMT